MTVTGIRIRLARPSDVDDVLRFWRAAAEGTSISDDPTGVARLIERDPEALLLAEEDSDENDGEPVIVGSVIAGWDGWRCHLYRLAVHPDHRRKGISRLLLESAEARFTAMGGRRGDAMVLDDNDLAHHAWRSAGYSPDPRWSRWIKPFTS